MHLRKRKWIYTLLIVAMIISGLSFEGIQLDSFLMQENTTAQTQISNEISTINDKNSDMCTGELLGLKKSTENIVGSNRPKGAKLSSNIIVFSNIPQKIAILWKDRIEKIDKIICMGTNSMQSIIQYIHEQVDYKIDCL